DLDRLLDRRLHDVDLLEAPRERVVLLEDTAVLVVSGRADAAQLAVCENGLDQIRRIHDSARRGARADHGVNLVDEQDRAGLLLQAVDDALEPLLEVASILGPGDERAHVERVDRAAAQDLGHFAFDDQAREALRERGLADPGLADEQRVVLAAPAQDLHRALDLELTTDQRIDLAG